MNHLTLHAYEDNGDLVIYRCPECGSTGEAGSRCGAHEPPLEMSGSGGLKREPVRVPGVGEEPAGVGAESVPSRKGSCSIAPRRDPATTPRPSADSDGNQQRGMEDFSGREDRCEKNSITVQTKDGNQQPQGGGNWRAEARVTLNDFDDYGDYEAPVEILRRLLNEGGDADADRRGVTCSGISRRDVAEGDSVQCDGVALAQLSGADLERAREEVDWLLSVHGQRDLIHRIVQTAAPIVEDGGTEEQLEAFAEVFVDACLVAHCLTQQSSGGQEGGVEEGAICANCGGEPSVGSCPYCGRGEGE